MTGPELRELFATANRVMLGLDKAVSEDRRPAVSAEADLGFRADSSEMRAAADERAEETLQRITVLDVFVVAEIRLLDCDSN